MIGLFGFLYVSGLAFEPNTNTLYGSAPNTNQLLNINTSTGSGSVAGSFGFLDVQGLTVHSAAVPEPSGFIMVGVGLYGFGVSRHRKRRRNTRPHPAATAKWMSSM